LADNLQRLCGPESRSFRGEPFTVLRTELVDLFPHTAHVELVLLLKRKEAALKWLKAQGELQKREGKGKGKGEGKGNGKRAGENEGEGKGAVQEEGEAQVAEPPRKRQKAEPQGEEEEQGTGGPSASPL